MAETFRMQDQAIQAAKTAPPAIIGAMTFAGIHMEHWIQLLTIVWLLLLIGGKLVSWFEAWRERRRAKDRAAKASRAIAARKRAAASNGRE